MSFSPASFPRFHLGSGAMVNAVHAAADVSANGVAQSPGALVNYLYDLSQITDNHEQFVVDKAVTASAEVRALSATDRSDTKEILR